MSVKFSEYVFSRCYVSSPSINESGQPELVCIPGFALIHLSEHAAARIASAAKKFFTSNIPYAKSVALKLPENELSVHIIENFSMEDVNMDLINELNGLTESSEFVEVVNDTPGIRQAWINSPEIFWSSVKADTASAFVTNGKTPSDCYVGIQASPDTTQFEYDVVFHMCVPVLLAHFDLTWDEI